MDDYRSRKCKAMCPASCSKCLRLRTELDLKNMGTKYANNENEVPSANKEYGSSILNVTEDYNIKARELTMETNLDAPKCPLCKLILPQIRNLVRDISIINIQDIPGICNHCKNINSTVQCERCDCILKKYMQEKECYVDHCNKECHEVIARIKTLLSEFEKHEELLKLKSLSLEELLKYMKPLQKTQSPEQQVSQGIYCGIQGGTQGFKNTCVCEELLKKLQEKLGTIDYKNYGKSFIDSQTPSPQMSLDQSENTKTIEGKQKYGKSFTDRKIPSRDKSYDQLEKTTKAQEKLKYRRSFIDSKIPSYPKFHDQLEKTKKNEKKQRKGEINDNKEATDFDNKDKGTLDFKKKATKNEQKQKGGEINITKEANDSNSEDLHKFDFKKSGAKEVIEQSKREKKTKSKKQSEKIEKDEISVDLKKVKVHNKSLDRFEKMILNQRKHKRAPQFNIKRFKMPALEELPPLPVKIHKERASKNSESTLECENLDVNDYIEVIEGNRIVRYKRDQCRVEPKTQIPLFFNVSHSFGESLADVSLPSPVYSKTNSLQNMNGLFGEYRLSNRNYIENGWTVLPTLTFVRRLNIYKMIPSDTQFDWLGSHRNQDVIFYETGEVLAEVNDDGLFKWFYRDGNVALDFVDVFDGETDATKEYIVYDKVTKTKKKYANRVQTLARFDDKGHGVVYDGSGCTRIKYNQDEGVVFDRNIGSPCHWKWNTLNEPPKIQVEHIFEFLDPLDPYIKKFQDKEKNTQTITDEKKGSPPGSQIKISSKFEDKRREVELNNVIKEKSMKILMNYKPFEIRSKIFKLNDYFSLRMLSQSKIYILFRDGKVSLKLNVGMKLISNEVIDIKAVDTDILYRQEKNIKITNI